MKIIIDADGCPVVSVTEAFAKATGIACVIVCDTSHFFESDYSDVITVSKGADSADYRIVNLISSGDVVVTQDYGLAAMCISRGAYAINQNGMRYDDGNIDGLLFFRAASAKARRAGVRMKGPKKRDKNQNDCYLQSLENLIDSIGSK